MNSFNIIDAVIFPTQAMIPDNYLAIVIIKCIKYKSKITIIISCEAMVPKECPFGSNDFKSVFISSQCFNKVEFILPTNLFYLQRTKYLVNVLSLITFKLFQKKVYSPVFMFCFSRTKMYQICDLNTSVRVQTKMCTPKLVVLFNQ